MSVPPCLLCNGSSSHILHRTDDRHGVREFWDCDECGLVFVPTEFHLPESAEIERYLMHNNAPSDRGYRDFLSRLWKVLKPKLPDGATGLDFGCGPGPALAQMMREEGFEISLYDPYFFPDKSVLEDRYDFVTCTETVEHLRTPLTEFRLIDTLIVPGGRLGVMTGMLEDRAGFSSWYYQRDPTHIGFYSRHTMLWVGREMGWYVEFPSTNVTIFRKPGPCRRHISEE